MGECRRQRRLVFCRAPECSRLDPGRDLPGDRVPAAGQLASHLLSRAQPKREELLLFALSAASELSGAPTREARRFECVVWYTHPREEDPVTVAKLLLAF